jgi:ABC-type branched-subunit amino acid transport system ATPase component
MTATLELAGVSSGYGEALVLRDLDLVVEPGEIFALLGKNGMGKSTLLKTIMGFLPARTGRIRIAGTETTGLAPHRVARRSIAYTPQEQALFQDLTVADNLKLVLPDARRVTAGLERIAAWFPVLRKRLHQRAGTLSGGEQKMLLVARALLTEPQLMLVDEITEGLQPTMVAAVAEALRSERQRGTVAILLVEQNVPFASAIADRFAVLKRGEIVSRGNVADANSRATIEEHLSV